MRRGYGSYPGDGFRYGKPMNIQEGGASAGKFTYMSQSFQKIEFQLSSKENITSIIFCSLRK